MNFDIVTHQDLALLMHQQYMSQTMVLYTFILRHSKIALNKSDVTWNVNLNTPARWLNGVLLLFEDPAVGAMGNHTYLDRPWLWRGPHGSHFYFIEPGEHLHDWLRLLFSLFADTPTLYIVPPKPSRKRKTSFQNKHSVAAMQNNLSGCSCRSIKSFAKICV